jgi:tRNA 2-thiouridine synthesizing protein E
MPLIDFDGRKLEVNEEGFLAHPEEWNREIAEFLGRHEEGLDTLSDDHWAVINYIREYWQENDLAPMVRKICKTTGFKLKYIYQLFPAGPAKGAAKLAGLPKPDGCV